MAKLSKKKVKTAEPENYLGHSYGGYGWTSLKPEAFAATTTKVLRKFGSLQERLGMTIDAVAFSGSSGAAMAFSICAKYETGLIYVRKENENSHGQSIEITSGGSIRTYLIIDDFIASGATVTRIHDRVAEYATESHCRVPDCIGVLLFQNAHDSNYFQNIGDDGRFEYPLFGLSI